MQAEVVKRWVEECRKRLPFQNPLSFFVHNNPVMPYEEEPFSDAMRRIARLYRARPFRPEAYYREALTKQRISREALAQALATHQSELSVDAFLAQTPQPDVMAQHAPAAERALQDLVIPLIATYVDQGIAGWHPPWRDSFWAYFVAAMGYEPRWASTEQGQLRAMLKDLGAKSSTEIVHELATRARPDAPQDYVLESAFLLKGWSGMVLRLQDDPQLLLNKKIEITMVDWLATLLVARLVISGEWEAQPLYDSRRLGIWQTAFELEWNAGLLHKLKQRKATQPAQFEYQALVCMDDREESFRRALEQGTPAIETYGSVGFYGVDMKYQALGAAKSTNQCPPVVTPSRTIFERGEIPTAKRLISAWVSRGSLLHYYATRRLAMGVALSLVVGIFHFIALALMVWSPRGAAALTTWANKRFVKPGVTSIDFAGDGGYSVPDQAQIVEGILRNAGLTRNFSQWVCVIAHTATTTNNPFQQAYGCGACSGNSGAPNARVFASMANSPQVRATLASRGVMIPDTTKFIPFLHDTTADTCQLLEPQTYLSVLAERGPQLQQTLTNACAKNAMERCERFVQAPRSRTVRNALAHVRARSLNLAQPRPEYGHSRVAACIVGRRELTASLQLDRRAFLVSYDPTQDTDGTILISAVLGTVPVAANIAYDYYFSASDNDSFGAGSKLPLNVCGLIGVITGSKSDLRIGLATQAVERHEPMRITVMLEASEPHIRTLLAASKRLRQLVEHEWIYLAQIDPDTRDIKYFKQGNFTAPQQLWPLLPATKPTYEHMFMAPYDLLGDAT